MGAAGSGSSVERIDLLRREAAKIDRLKTVILTGIAWRRPMSLEPIDPEHALELYLADRETVSLRPRCTPIAHAWDISSGGATRKESVI